MADSDQTPDTVMSLSLVSWALNEEENVGSFLARAESFARSVASDFEVLVIDDGSTDATWVLLQQAAAERPWLRLVRNDRNLGVGYCTKLAIRLASKERVLWQTQDWSYDLSWFSDNWGAVYRFPVVHGSRWLAAEGRHRLLSRSDNTSKALISLCNLGLIKVLFGLPFSDVQNVTLYSTKLAQSFQLRTASSFTNPECLIWAWSTGVSVLEVPVAFVPRTAGVAKGTRPRAIVKAIRDIFAFRFGPQPKRAGTGHIIRWPLE